ncbi:putative high mobility group protein b1 [Cardiosporidium cionae]|uniref:High mobility group protein b1 n=1 Tax=Cardiosporidium cionae TaxID=476202 RepID=A0ABQ7JAG3_9APIC|nr:putative high mobility group protein b1 [Cardiosporidium cionae]|eukprot:KAF8820992.1 putative high mobility group protein b1 [Cardiosporidium cionae]
MKERPGSSSSSHSVTITKKEPRVTKVNPTNKNLAGKKHQTKKVQAKQPKATSQKKKIPQSAENEEHVPGDARKYFKEGQKYISPPNGDGTRAFYESLREEFPYSLIAIKYCIEFGILNGIKHRETMALYRWFSEKGAFKGPGGGIKSEFSQEQIEKLIRQRKLQLQ